MIILQILIYEKKGCCKEWKIVDKLQFFNKEHALTNVTPHQLVAVRNIQNIKRILA